VNESRDEPIIPADGRLITIDILRGLAILWVVVYHLWGLSAVGYRLLPAPRTYYERFWERLRDGDGLAASTAFTDLVFRLGNNGVTVFMILSGISLTISATRKRGAVSASQFYALRLRKLLIPYWAGWAIYVATLAIVALYRVPADGGTFRHNFEYLGLIHQGDPHQLIAGLLIFPRVLEFNYLFAPAPALWFVPLMLQYYLLFPVLQRLVERMGPLAFAGAGFVVSVGFTAWLIWEYGSVGARGYYWGGLFPFRLFEFAIGMSIGYAMVTHPRVLRRAFASAPALLALGALGLGLHTWGSWLDARSGYWESFGYPLLTAGFAALVLALVVVRPGVLLSSPPARLMAFVGTVSYTVLIVNEVFRHVNGYLIVQGHQWSAGWWWYIVVLYVPLTVVFAYPLAAVLGLLPASQARGREPTRGATPPGAPP